MSRRRILYLSLSSTRFGGGETYLLKVLEHFAQSCDVYVAGAVENSLMSQRVREMGLPLLEMPLGYLTIPAGVRALRRWHSQHGFELVHANGRRSQLFGGLLGLPLVVTDQLPHFSFGSSGVVWLRNLAAVILNSLFVVRRVRRIITVSDYIARERRAVQRVPSHRLVTIYNAADVDFFQPRAPDPQLQAQLGIAPGQRVLIVVARLFEHKGHSLLIEALHRLGRRDILTLFLGDGPFEPNLRAQVEGLGQGSSYRFLGFQPDVRPYLALADAAVLPSRDEGLPFSLVEAMAMGLPVIGTDTQGFPELISNGLNGYLFRRGDVAELAQRVQQLLDDPQRSELGKRARQRAVDQFSLTTMLEATAAVYQQVLAESI